jgi:hypothetical protein
MMFNDCMPGILLTSLISVNDFRLKELLNVFKKAYRILKEVPKSPK